MSSTLNSGRRWLPAFGAVAGLLMLQATVAQAQDIKTGKQYPRA